MVWQANRATDNNITGLVLPQSIIAPISGPVPTRTSNRSAWGSAAGLLFSWEPFDFGYRGARVGAARAARDPFLSIEQAALAHVVPDQSRTEVFAWYTLAGSLATATGALFAGAITNALQRATLPPVTSYRVVVVLYAITGVLLACLFLQLSSAAEAHSSREASALPTTLKSFLGIGQSQRVVMKLSSLFALDSFAGGFVVQSLRFGVQPAMLGVIFFWANIFAGISALLAPRLAARWGLVNTMVLAHLPSNILLIFVPLMPNLWLAVLVLLLRFSISQMDVPTRQSYVMAVVNQNERSAAAGITGVARTTGAALSPLFVGFMFARPSWIDVPFFLAGSLKILYDLLLYQEFAGIQPVEE
jgi:MFS family permease